MTNDISANEVLVTHVHVRAYSCLQIVLSRREKILLEIMLFNPAASTRSIHA